MEQTTSSPTQNEIQSAVKIQLLENNEVIYDRIEKAGDKIARSLNEKMEPLLGQLVKYAETQGAMEVRIAATESKLSNLWAKMIGVGAGCASVAGLLGFLISQITGK